MEAGAANALFEHLVINGDIYNSGVKVKNNEVERFEIYGMIIEENTDYDYVMATVNELNTLVKSDINKYIYREQIITQTSNGICYERVL